MAQMLLESAMQYCVTSFQRVSEQLYERRTGRVAKRNAFQRLGTGSELWEAELGVTYTDILGEEALTQLTIYFQQRHLLVHQQGIVDADYLTRSQDTQYKIGQRLVIRQAEVLRFVTLIEKLAKSIMEYCDTK